MSPTRTDSAKVLTLLFIFISYTKCNVNNEETSDSYKSSYDLGGAGSRDGWLLENFIVSDSLADGELETRIHLDGLIAKETSATKNGTGIILRQMTNGRQFLQMILSAEGDPMDCEYVQKKSAVKRFVKGFYGEIIQHPKLVRSQGQMNQEFECDFDADGKTILKCKKKNGKPIKRRRKLDSDTLSEEDGVLRPNYRHFYSDGKRRREVRPAAMDPLRNVTVRVIESSSDLSEDVLKWLDFKTMKKKCDSIHDQLKLRFNGADEMQHRNYKRTRRSQEALTIFPGTLWCGAGQLAESYPELGPMTETDACCREHDHCPSKVGPLRHHAGIFNPRGYTVSHCLCDRRRVSRSTVLVPGTRWCGKGNSGIRNDLGEFGEADRCCRMHDNSCPIWIESMETKYGYFNWRPNTIMHCRCDERFRTCLKRANTDISNMVGKLFFNVIQTKCFVLKPVKGCIEHSWWGKCLKMGHIKQARLRDNLSY